MSLVIATSVYHLRKSRPIEYYLQPTIDLLSDLTNSNINVCVFTDQNKDLFPKGNNIHIFQISPEELIKEMWNKPNWKQEYQESLKIEVEQKDIPDLLAIWLGKFPMMKLASEYGDHVLWQDSGIRMPRLFNKDFSKYKKCEVKSESYNDFTSSLLSKKSIVFMTCDSYLVPYHGVNMRKYSRNKTLVRAGFILTKTPEIPLLQDQVKEKWNFLVDNGDYGTEENAMTFLSWERKDIGLISYDAWLDGLVLI